MHRVHLVVGVGSLLLFLATGAYMLFGFPELYQQREEIRMMYRATHIYLLMSSLINLMSANFISRVAADLHPRLSGIASLLIVISSALLAAAFFIEPQDYLIDRPITFWAVVFLLAGVLVHTILNTLMLRSKRN